jgi:D-alanine-D-alanine ligase
MRIGFTYDLKDTVPLEKCSPEDALEEYDYGATIELISGALKNLGHTMVRLGGGRDFLAAILRETVDIVFNIAEGRGTYRSREAQVPSVLEMLNVPYTGSDPQCLAICLDKPLTKKLAAMAVVAVPKEVIINSTQELKRMRWDNFPFPAIVKPIFEGSSKGIRLTSVARNRDEITELSAQLIECYRQPVMVEEFIAGDEVTVGMVGNSPPHVLGMMRILPRQKYDHFVYSLEVKRDWKNTVDYECPPRLDASVLKNLEKSAINAFQVPGCRDFARVDYRIGNDGTPYFLEINPLPGLGDYSDLVIMAQKMGWTYDALIGAVLSAALGRYPLCGQQSSTTSQ